MTATELQKKYGNIPVYRGWNDLPVNLFTKTGIYNAIRVHVPANAKPDAIKNSASANDKDRHFLLFDIEKYRPK